MMYKLFCQKNLCVLPSSVGLRVEDGVLATLRSSAPLRSTSRGEGPISSSISMRVILIGAAVAGRKRIYGNALRRFRRLRISDRVLLLSAGWKRT